VPDPARFRECLNADYTRLREVATRDLNAQVPSCPGWDVAELVRHTGAVYLHKVQAMREGAEPESWPPAGVNEKEPLDVLDWGFTDLNAEFDARDPKDATGTWFGPDQTVGFWIRRMAQESVIHRVDAELALDEPIAAIPDDLAIDGIDEVLVCFLEFASTNWRQYFPALDNAAGRSVRIAADGASWNAEIAKDGVHIGKDGDAEATVSGKPGDVLLWLWRRKGDEAVTKQGDTALIDELRELLGTATQ
jgi:uncharacterized protein (TIGR03083 family)